MFRSYLVSAALLLSAQILWAQVMPELSLKKEFNFNLKDSQVWSSELGRIDVTRMKVDMNHEVAMMRFQSSDGSFQINCLKMLKGFSQAENRAACHIATDASLSVQGITDFQNSNNGQVQKIDFHDPRDLKKLNQLVDESAAKLYKTRQLVSVLDNNQTVSMPLLTASCSNLENCTITMAQPLSTTQAVGK